MFAPAPAVPVDKWYAAIKQGHTFVTNGPMLLLTVGEAIPGDELRVGKDAKVRVRAEAWAPELIGTPKLLGSRFARPGGPLGRVARRRNRRSSTAEFELPAGESQWIAARTTTFNGAVAHTSPVYVIVDGESFMDRSQLPQLVAKRLKVLDFVEARMHDPRFTRSYATGRARRVAQTRCGCSREDIWPWSKLNASIDILW